MSYVYKTKWSGSEIQAEYCYSSLDNCIKVVELKVDGKFHRMNWMGPNGRVIYEFTLFLLPIFYSFF